MSVVSAAEGTHTRVAYRRLPLGQRRDEILTAAIATFSTNPEASIADVAEAAGVSRTSLYRYFADRQELLHAAFRRAGDELVAHVGEAVEGPPSQILMTRLHGFVDHVERVGPAFLGFLQAGSTLMSEEIREVAEDVRRRIGAMVYEALHVTEVTTAFDVTVRSWVAGVESVVIDWLRTGRPNRTELETLLSSQLGMMLIGAAAWDPVVAERLEWWMSVEPHDGVWGHFARRLGDGLNRNLVAHYARLLVDRPPHAAPPPPARRTAP
ncbi:TetR/AcrR family transcriptional regulator [Actinomadura sp. NPDC047616]|uniref:TetR/AcrR family transcriptional regulator n=1 Tax=Actinomadura sp. NPDC047616 TaxID=3155914 RepID=UPI0033F94582